MSRIERNQDLLYSGLTILSTPVLFYVVIVDWFQNVVTDNEDLAVPNPKTSLYIVSAELVKILIVTGCWPTEYILDSKLDNDGKKYRLPFSRNQKKVNSEYEYGETSKVYAVFIKVVHILNGVVNFLAGIVMCHLMLVLFGAPIMNKWKLSLEFSCLLVTWLYFPLTFVIRPSSILHELVYISSWKHENSSLCRAKWRFLLTLFGAWIGAGVIPLDWDRPWQKWPIPCVISSFVTFSLVNLLYSIYLLYGKIKGPVTESRFSSAKTLKSPIKSKKHY